MKRIVIALTVVLAHLCVLAGANVKSARLGSLRASQTVVTNVTGAVSQSDVDATIAASNLIGRADASRDFVGTNKANSVGSGFSIVDAGGSSVLGIGKDETDSDVWRGGLYAKGVIDDYGTRKYGVKLEKNEYSPKRGRVCVRDAGHFYWEPVASSNDVERMSRSIATNAAYQVVTNAVGDGYLCTVEAAEAMVVSASVTNVVDGIVASSNLVSRTLADRRYLLKTGTAAFADGASCVRGSLLGDSVSIRIGDGYAYVKKPFNEETGDPSVQSKLIPDGTDYATISSISNLFPVVTNAYTKTETDCAIEGRLPARPNDALETWIVYTNVYFTGKTKFLNNPTYFGYYADFLGWNLIRRQYGQNDYETLPQYVANTSTNAAEAVVGDVLQYALTNITDNTERFELESGTIGNLYLDGDHTNIWLTLKYPARNDRASDTLLRVVCVSNSTLAISSAYTDVDGSGWQNVPKGTNTIAATRVAFKDGRSIVNVAVKSW